jgi:PAS domain S-box-containing protein
MSRQPDTSALGERMLQIFESLEDVIGIYDHEWRVVFLNEAARNALRSLNPHVTNPVGQVIWELAPQLKGTRFESETLRASKAREVTEYEEFQPDLGLWFDVRIIPIEEGVVAFSRDITARKAAEQAVGEGEHQFLSMVNAIPNLAWVANADGYITWYNERWYEYTGTTPEQMEGWGWQSVHDPEVLPAVLERWTDSIRTGQPFEMEFPILGADGKFRPFLTRVAPVRDSTGTLVRWVGTNTDVSEQRAAVSNREQLLQLERAARAAAEEANRAKSQFLATMSHELRTPLNAIAGYADLLDAEVHGALNEQQRTYLLRLQRSQRLLLSHINDILNYAKLEAGTVQYNLRTVQVSELIAELNDVVEVQARQAGVEYIAAYPQDVSVYADPEKVLQILLNLCSNGLKAMPEGGRLEVSCKATDCDVQIAVTDTGTGIAESRLDVIFEPFVQLDRDYTATKKEGTGLGLTISRDLAAAMNGSLTVRSELGRGSTFILALPRQDWTRPELGPNRKL